MMVMIIDRYYYNLRQLADAAINTYNTNKIDIISPFEFC